MGWFSKFIKKIFPQNSTSTNSLTYLGGASFNVDSAKEFNATYSNCADALARHISKLKIEVKNVLNDDATLSRFRYLNYLLEYAPNETQTASNLLHALAYDYYFCGSCFAHLDWQDITRTRLRAIYPIEISNLQVASDDNGELVFSFLLSGKRVFADARDIVFVSHGARSGNPISTKNPALNKIMEILATNDEGMVKAIENANTIRFIISQPGNANEKMKLENQRMFEEQISSAKSALYVTNAASITQVNPTTKWIEDESVKELKNEIYAFFNVTADFVQSKYNENEWQAIFEGAIEPFIIALKQALTIKLFSRREFDVGNRIEIMSDPLQTASLQTRIKLAETYLKLPIIVPNIVNRLLYLPESENGNKEVQSLNYVNSLLADKYQTGNSDNGSSEEANNDNQGGQDNGNE